MYEREPEYDRVREWCVCVATLSGRKNTYPVLVIFLVCRDCQVRTSGDRDVRIAGSNVAVSSALTIAFRVRKKERNIAYVYSTYTYERVRERQTEIEKEREREREKLCVRERIGK